GGARPRARPGEVHARRARRGRAEPGAAPPLVPRPQAPRPVRRPLRGRGRSAAEALSGQARGLRRAGLCGPARPLTPGDTDPPRIRRAATSRGRPGNLRGRPERSRPAPLRTARAGVPPPGPPPTAPHHEPPPLPAASRRASRVSLPSHSFQIGYDDESSKRYTTSFVVNDATFDAPHDQEADHGEEDGAAGGEEPVRADRFRRRVAQEIGDETDQRRPRDPARSVPGEEAPSAHAREAGRPRRGHPQDSDEATEEHGLAAVSGEEPLTSRE